MEYTIDFTQSELQQKSSYYEPTDDEFGGESAVYGISRTWIYMLTILALLFVFVKLITHFFPKAFSSQSDTDVYKGSSRSSSPRTEPKPENESRPNSDLDIAQNKTKNTQNKATTRFESNEDIVETDQDLQRRFCTLQAGYEFCKMFDRSFEQSMRDLKTYSRRSKSNAEKKPDFKTSELDNATKGQAEIIDPDLDLLRPRCSQIQNKPNINSTYCNSFSHASSTQSHAKSSSCTQSKTESEGVAKQSKPNLSKVGPTTSAFNLSDLETEMIIPNLR